jgi:hypothetical protein
MTIPSPGQAGPSLRAGLIACGATALIALLVALAEGRPAEWPSGLFDMLAPALVAIALLACGIWAMRLLFLVRAHGPRCAMPFMICAATAAALAFVPFTQAWLAGNFWWQRDHRERIVARIERGELTPNVIHNDSLIALGEHEPAVSDGNEIVVDRRDGGTYVLFLTSRGVRHRFTGFLRVPPGGDPARFFEFEDGAPRQAVRYGKDWYFVAN